MKAGKRRGAAMGREAGARCGHFGTVEAALFCHGDGNGQKGTVTAAASATTRQNDPSREVAASHSFAHSISRSQRTSSFRRQASAWHANNCPTVTIPRHPSAANGCPLSPRPIALSPVTVRPCRRFSFSFPRAANRYWGRLSESRN
jgi:hypothetical protein